MWFVNDRLTSAALLCTLAALGACSEYQIRGELEEGEGIGEDVPIQPPTEPVLPEPPQRPDGQVIVPHDPCAPDLLDTKLYDIAFAERAGCGWEQGENLSPLDRWIRAIETDAVSIQLGPDEVLCDLRVEFSTDAGGISFPLEYDDQLIFTFNDRVVFTSDERFIDQFRTDANGLAVFDWLSIRDMEMWFDNTTPWAVGSGYTLELPGHATAGNAEIAIDPVAISGLTAAAEQSSEVVLALHALGDDDPTDCGHSGMGFWIELDIGFRE